MNPAWYVVGPVVMARGLMALAFFAQGGAPAAPPPAPAEVRPLPEWDAKFDGRDGWIGGDGAYAVALGPERTLWTFSDTWVGKVRDGRRIDATMVNNTAAIQDGHGAGARLRFVVRRGSDGKPAALIAPSDGRGWFWFQDGVVVGGKLYLFLVQTERAGEGAFGFRQVAQWLGVVANPLDEPSEWRVEQRKLPCADFAGTRRLSFGAAILRMGDDLYLYGTDEVQDGRSLPNKHMILARVKADTLGDPSTWRFHDDGRWSPDFRRASHLADGMGNDYSVTYDPATKRYLAITTDRGMTDRIMARSAEAPWGVWSSPVLIYRCPEMKADKKVFCYGAKAIATESTGGETVINYLTNSLDFWQVARDARLYRPRFVGVRWREDGARPGP